MIVKRAGLIGDVHAEDETLAVVLDHFSTLSLDAILCVGDIVDGPGDPNRCASLLADAGAACVRGNHDRWLLEGTMRDLPFATDPATVSTALRDYLASLPPTVDFQTPSGQAMLCHGLLANDMSRLTPDDFGYALSSNDDLQYLLDSRDYKAVIGGHTHRRMVRWFDHLTVINTGTLLRGYEPGFAIADFGEGQVQFYLLDHLNQISEGTLFGMAP